MHRRAETLALTPRHCPTTGNFQTIVFVIVVRHVLSFRAFVFNEHRRVARAASSPG